MDLLRLDERFQAESIVDDYESLIWTERYSTLGDFELVTSAIESTLSALPRETCVSIGNSTSLMIVEDHYIIKKKSEAPMLKVVGRDYTSVLDRRVSTNRVLGSTTPVEPWRISAAKESDAAWLVMRTVLGDEARSILGWSAPALSPINPGDEIPEINLVQPVDFEVDTNNEYEIPTKYLLETVHDMIRANRRGLKATRPFDPNKETVDIEIYNGADLSEEVVFDSRYDEFEEVNYLFSERGLKNVGYVLSPSESVKVLRNTPAPEPTGLRRRVLLVDGSSGGDSPTGEDLLYNRGLIELYKNNAVALFDGGVSDQIASGYNKDYFLGDIVTLFGEYGLSSKYRVAELIRTSDASGTKVYPTLEIVDE